MNVPYLNLKVQYEAIREEVDAALCGVLERTAFAGGPFVEAFEQEFAAYCNCKYGVGVGSGTDALWLALDGLGVGPYDEVITVPNTFIATAEAISLCGAKPVFVDIDERTYNMNPELLEAAITEHTKAIIPVHLYGQPVDMDPVMKIARAHGLHVIEDAAQAHGAEYNGKVAGSLGDAGCFSFYPGKNLGAYGEAGALVTDNEAIVKRARMFRDHGQAKKYYHSLVGWNARMDGFQGAILSVKLKHLPDWTELRRRNAQLFNEGLKDVEGVITPYEAPFAKHVYHVYEIRVKQRDKFIESMKEKEIYCAIHYPVPLHLQEAYQALGYSQGDFPVSERVADEIVSLPMFPELTPEQIAYAVSEIKSYMASA